MSNIDKELESRFLKSSQLRLKSSKDGILRTGPEFVRIGVSRLCNFNCITCWHYSPLLKEQKSAEWKKVKIEKDLVFTTLNQVARLGCMGILFSGAGEPFTHPHMMEFIKKTKENKMLVRIQTNLSLVEDPAELAHYLRSAADLVCVHLSAATPETYVKMHPNQPKKKFHQILDRIQILREKDVPVRLVYVVNKLNYQEIPEVFRLNEDLGAKLHLELMDFNLNSGLGRIALDKAEKEKIICDLLKLRARKEYQMRNNINDFIGQLKHSALGLKELTSCAIGYFYSIVDELGNVFYCYNNDVAYRMGNLRKQSFKDIWFSQKYHKLRLRCLKGRFLGACQKCMKERGSNFKVRIFIEPKLRDFDMERRFMFCKTSSVDL